MIDYHQHCVDNQCLLHGTMTQHSSMSPPVVGLTPCHDAMMSFFIAFPIITIIFIIIIITNFIHFISRRAATDRRGPAGDSEL